MCHPVVRIFPIVLDLRLANVAGTTRKVDERASETEVSDVMRQQKNAKKINKWKRNIPPEMAINEAGLVW